ncbi:MAG: hypothetical protein AAF945_08110 [Actinomycetota bacterium]
MAWRPASGPWRAAILLVAIAPACSLLTDPVEQGADDPVSGGADVVVPGGSESVEPSTGESGRVQLAARHVVGEGRALLADTGGGRTVVATTSRLLTVEGDTVVDIPSGLAGDVRSVDLTPDGSAALVAGVGGGVEVWRVGDEPALVAGFSDVTRESNGGTRAAVAVGGDLQLVDTASGEVDAFSIGEGRDVVALDVSSGGSAVVAVVAEGESLSVLRTGPSAEFVDSPLGLDPAVRIDTVAVAESSDRLVAAHGRLDDPFAGQLSIWDGDTAAEPVVVDLPAAGSASRWAVTGDGTVWWLDDPVLRAIDPAGVEVEVPVEIAGESRAVVPGPGSRAALVSDSGDVQIVESGSTVGRFTLADADPLFVSDLGDRLAVVDLDGTLHDLDVATGATDRIERFVAAPVTSVGTSATGELAVAATDGTVTVASVGDPFAGRSLVHPEGRVTAVEFSPDGGSLVTGVAQRRTGTSFDDTVSVYGQERSDRVFSVWGEAESNPLCTFFDSIVRYTNDGSRIIATSHDFTASVLDAATGDLIHQFPAEGGTILDVAVSEDDAQLITSADGGRVAIWDLDTFELVGEFAAPPGGLWSIALLPGGATLVGSDLSGRLVEVDTTSGAVLRTFASSTARASRLSLSTDGRFLASGAESGIVRVWDVASGELAAEATGHVGAVPAVSFSSDSTSLVTGSVDGTVVVWDLVG